MTPLWEELAGRTEDAAATIKGGENAQVGVHKAKSSMLFCWIYSSNIFLLNSWLVEWERRLRAD